MWPVRGERKDGSKAVSRYSLKGMADFPAETGPDIAPTVAPFASLTVPPWAWLLALAVVGQYFFRNVRKNRVRGSTRTYRY